MASKITGIDVGTSDAPRVIPPIPTNTPIPEPEQSESETDVPDTVPPSTPVPVVASEWKDISQGHDLPKSPDEGWVDLPDPATDPLVARDGARHDQDASIDALDKSRGTDFNPQHFMPEGSALDPGTAQYQRTFLSFQKFLETSPGLMAYASRTPMNAAAVAADAGQWSAVEQFLTGKIHNLPVPSGWSPTKNGVYDPGLSDYVRIHGGIPEQDAPPVWVGAFAKGTEQLITSFQELALTGLRSLREFAPSSWEGTQAPSPQEAALEQSISSSKLRTAGPIRGVSGVASGIAAGVAGIAPDMMAFAATGGLGKGVGFGYAWAKGSADLKLAGVDNGLAAAGGFVSALATMLLLPKALGSLLPRDAAGEATSAGVAAFQQLIRKPSLIRTGVNITRHALYGGLFSAAMGVTNSLTLQAQEGKLDLSKTFNDMAAAAEDSWKMIPFGAVGPIMDHMEMKGRWLEAHMDAASIGTSMHLINQTKLGNKSTTEAKDVLVVMGARPVYLDMKVINSAAKAWGMDPMDLVTKLTGQPGAGEDAMNTQTPVRVPGESLALLKDFPDEVMRGAKYNPHGITLEEAEAIPKEALGAAPDDVSRVNKSSPLGALIAEWSELSKEPQSPERSAKFVDLQRRMSEVANNAALGRDRSSRGGMGVPYEGRAPPLTEESLPPSPPPVGAAPVSGETVFRVENAAGNGPYAPDFPDALREEFSKSMPEDRETPGISEDFGPDSPKGKFGFPDRKSAVRWFGEKGLKFLEDHGYTLKEVRAGKVTHSRTGSQVIYEDAPEPTPGAPLPGTGDATAPELRRYAVDAVSRMTLGQIDASSTLYTSAARTAQRNHESFLVKAADLLAKAEGTAQTGIEKGIQSGEAGRKSSLENRNFARTARFREWLKGLQTQPGVRETPPTPPERGGTAETGLYDVPGIPDVKVERSLAEKWKNLGEDQRKYAIKYFKESERAQQAAEDQSVKATEKVVNAGDAMQQAAAHARLRDLNNAMETARTKAQKEGQRIESYVDEMSGDDIQKSTYKAGTHYGIVLDSVMESLGKRPINRQRPDFSLDDAARAIIAGGDELPFNLDHLRELAANPREMSDLLPWEADNVENAIRGIRRLAIKAGKTYKAGKEIERADVIAEMTTEVAKGSKGGKYTFGEERRKIEGISDILPAIERRRMRSRAELSYADTLWRKYGSYGTDRMHQLDYALKFESDLTEGAQKILEIPKELRKMAEDDVDLPNVDRTNPKFQFLPDKLKRMDLWRMAGMSGNKSGMAKLAAGYGVPEAEIIRTLHSQIKTRAEWDFIDSRFAGNEQLYAFEAAVHARRSGLLPVKLEPRPYTVRFEDGTEKSYKGGYDPFRWEPRSLNNSRLPVISAMDPYAGMRALQGLDTPHQFLKERVENFAAVPDPSWSSLKSHYAALIHDISHSDYIRDTHRMVNDPAFRDMTLNYLGAPHYDALKSWLDVTARGHTVNPSNGATYYDSLFSQAKGLAAAGAFNLNFQIIAMQPSHLVTAAAGLGINPSHIAVGMGKAITPEGWNEAGESSVVAYRHEGNVRKINKMWGDILGYGPNKYRENLSWASQEAQHWMDTWLSRVMWHAGKEKALLDDKLSPEDARLAADDAVRRAMPPISVTQQSALNRSRLYGFLSMVKVFPGTIENMKMMMDWDTRVGINQGANPIIARSKQVGRTAALIGGLGLGMYLGGHGKRDDETWQQYFGRSILTEASYGKPLGHIAMQAISPTLAGEGVGKTNALNVPAFEMVDRLLQDAGKLADRDQPNDERMWAALDALGRTIGAPLPPPLLRSAKGVYKLTRYHLLGENDFTHTPRGPFDEASIAAYGETKTTTPFVDTQTALSGVGR